MTQRFDVAVVGSGFGGSILACRLAQAARSVCVLERGRRWNATDFPRSPSQAHDPDGRLLSPYFGALLGADQQSTARRRSPARRGALR